MSDVNVDENVETNEAVNEADNEYGSVSKTISDYIAKVEAEENEAALAEMKVDEETEGDAETVEKTSEEKPLEKSNENKEDPGLQRLMAREEEVRKKEVDFDKRVADAVKAKLPDVRGKSPAEVLKSLGIDPDLALKQMMYEKASPDNPVRAKLGEELRDWNVKRELETMKAQLEARDMEAQRSQYFQTVADGARKHVESVDEKVAPVFAEVAKAKPDYVHKKIMQVIISDAKDRLARGEDGDPLSYADAVKAVEEDFKVIAEALSKKETGKTQSKSVASPALTMKKPIVKPKANLSHDDMIQAAISQAMGVYEKEENKARSGKR